MTGYGYVDLEKSMAVIAAKELDVLVGDQSAFDYYCKSEVFSDITTVLPDDLMEQFKDKLYYYTNEETNETLPLELMSVMPPNYRNITIMMVSQLISDSL